MYIPMHDLPQLPCNNSTPIALCMSIGMHVHGIKQGKHKMNSNSNMWRVNKQTNMWNRDIKPWKHEKVFKTEVYIWKQKQK